MLRKHFNGDLEPLPWRLKECRHRADNFRTDSFRWNVRQRLVRIDKRPRDFQGSALICNGLISERELMICIMSKLVPYVANLVQVETNIISNPCQCARN